MSEETVTFNLELNVEKAFSASRRIELIIFRALGLWNRLCRMLGLPDDSPIMAITQKVQQIVMVIRQLHTSLILIESASGPLGWAMAALSVAGGTLSAYETITGV
jgi:hypothetical protein